MSAGSRWMTTSHSKNSNCDNTAAQRCAWESRRARVPARRAAQRAEVARTTRSTVSSVPASSMSTNTSPRRSMCCTGRPRHSRTRSRCCTRRSTAVELPPGSSRYPSIPRHNTPSTSTAGNRAMTSGLAPQLAAKNGSNSWSAKSGAKPLRARNSGTVTDQSSRATTPLPRARTRRRASSCPIRPGERNSAPTWRSEPGGNTIWSSLRRSTSVSRLVAGWGSRPSSRHSASTVGWENAMTYLKPDSTGTVGPSGTSACTGTCTVRW